MTKGAITEFQGKYRFLSNFFLAEVELDGMTFTTVEHAYQAAKTNNHGLRMRIRDAATPGRAKRLGHGVPLVAHWDTRKFLVMYDLLGQKFEGFGELGGMLVATGDALLVEGNTWHDNIWGDCWCTSHGCAGFKGENWLGRLLMVVREDLR